VPADGRFFAALESANSFDHRANVPAKENLVGVWCFAVVMRAGEDPVLVRAIGRVLAPQAQYLENRLRQGQRIAPALGLLVPSGTPEAFGIPRFVPPSHLSLRRPYRCN